MIHHPNGRVERGDTPLWLWNIGKALLWLFYGTIIIIGILQELYGPYGNYTPGWPH